jgi:hypothetical protein
MSAPVFLPAGELATPLANAGTESLDRWLLDVPGKLLRSEPVDLRTAPAGVSWVELDGTEDHQRRLRAACADGQGCVLIIGTPGTLTVSGRLPARRRGP